MSDRLATGDPDVLGPFTLVRRLGAGGMGRVFEGRSADGGRVAVKVVHDWLAEDPVFRERFRREADAVARAGGPGVARLVAADTEAPAPWLAVEFVDGWTLEECVRRRGPLPGPAVLDLARDVAAALVDVHAAGVVHRDLKPTNVMLDDEGVRLVDFGIARATDGTRVTRSGETFGSSGYMAPEQLTGGEATPATDVYALGALLHHAATGHGLHDGLAPGAVVQRVLSGPPDLSAIADPAVRDLVARCLATRPEDRPTPAELAAPPVVPGAPAVPGTPVVPPTTLVSTAAVTEVAGRGPGRRAVLMAAGGFLAVAASGATTVALLPRSRRGARTAPAGEGPTASDGEPGSDPRGAPAGAPADGAAGGAVAGRVAGVAFLPPGTLLLTVGRGTAGRLRDGSTGRTLRVFAGGVEDLVPSPDGARVAVRVRGGVRVVPTAVRGDGQHVPFPARSAAFTPDGRYLVMGGADGRVRWWDLAGARLARAVPGAAAQVLVAPDGSAVVTGDGTGYVVRDPASGTVRATLAGLPGRGALIVGGGGPAAAGGAVLAVADPAGSSVTRRVLGTGASLPALALGARHPTALATEPAGTLLVAGTDDGTVRVWDARTGSLRRDLGVPGPAVESVAVSAGGLAVAACDTTGRLRVWDVASGTLRRPMGSTA